MKPAAFDYAAPGSLEEVFSLLQQHPDGEVKLLAGGQSLMPLLTMRMARPQLLVDLNRIEALQYIREEAGGLAIGAMTRKHAVEDSEAVQRLQPLLVAGTRLVAHRQIRHRGTVGGSMAHADPASEYPALALALDMEFEAASAGGVRHFTAADFFRTYLTTALGPQEVLTEVRVPVLPEDSGWSIREVSRRHGDYALSGVVARLRLAPDGTLVDTRLVLFAVGPTPIRLPEVEALLAGERPRESLYQDAARAALQAIGEPLSDIHASAEYRLSLAKVLVERGLREAVERALVAKGQGGRS